MPTTARTAAFPGACAINPPTGRPAECRLEPSVPANWCIERPQQWRTVGRRATLGRDCFRDTMLHGPAYCNGAAAQSMQSRTGSGSKLVRIGGLNQRNRCRNPDVASPFHGVIAGSRLEHRGSQVGFPARAWPGGPLRQCRPAGAVFIRLVEAAIVSFPPDPWRGFSLGPDIARSSLQRAATLGHLSGRAPTADTAAACTTPT